MESPVTGETGSVVRNPHKSPDPTHVYRNEMNLIPQGASVSNKPGRFPQIVAIAKVVRQIPRQNGLQLAGQCDMTPKQGSDYAYLYGMLLRWQR